MGPIIEQVKRPGAKEVKAAKLLSSSRGIADLQSAIRGIAAARGIPFLVVAEKKYAIAGKVIDTYLDPVYNERICNEWTWDSDLKQDAAEKVYGLPMSTLSEFASVYRTNDAAGLERSLESIVEGLSKCDGVALADLILGAKGRMAEMAGDESEAVNLIKGIDSLNLPVFFSLLQLAESLGRSIGAAGIALLHDETREFSGALRTIYEGFRNGVGGGVLLPNEAVIHGRLETLEKLEYVASHESYGIQAAEMLVGGTRKVTEYFARNLPVPQELMPIAALTLPALLQRVPKIAWVLGAKGFFAAWARTLQRLA